MSPKEINTFLTIPANETKSDQGGSTIQVGNIAFKHIGLRRTIYFWDNNLSTQATLLSINPFKNGGLLDDNDTVGHALFSLAVGTAYPVSPATNSINVDDFSKFRSTGTTTTVLSTDIPRVFGSIAAYDQLTPSVLAPDGFGEGDSLVSINDVPLDYTQIGILYQHPAHVQANTVTTGVGLNYVTYTDAQFWDQVYFIQGCFNLIRLETGTDAGYYYVQHNDAVSNRLYLRNIDGTVFSGLAAATIAATACPGRRAYFNEVGIIQLSTGTVETSGRFNPRKLDPQLRGSFIMRVIFDKTGTTEAAVGTEQQGSYFISLRPYTHGYGTLSDATADTFDSFSTALLSRNVNFSTVPQLPFGFNFIQGGVSAMTLDWTSQRLWFGYTNSSNQSGIAHWRWKTNESLREVANYLGTPGQGSLLSPQIILGAGDIIRGSDIGSNRWVYFAINHATGGNAGLTIIKPDLTTVQYRLADGVPSSVLSGAAVDKTRARLGTSGDVVTTIATANLGSASGAFTASDIGRVIKISGATADNGTYKIATITSGILITVQTLAGAAVSFTGGTGGTFEIGDRVYMFFNNGTTGAGKINYMESLAPGTFLTRTVSMTNGANCTVYVRSGEKQKISIDPANGNVYWLSNDTQQQINKYEVSTNIHTFRTIANIQSPAGGSGVITNATAFTAIHVNSKFNEIWVGTDFGQVKLVKNDFAGANYKRYFGIQSTTYVNPTGFPRSSGSATTGSSYVRNFHEHADGRMQCHLQSTSTTDIAFYSRESDNWHWRNNDIVITSTGSDIGQVRNEVHDPYGTSLGVLFPSNTGLFNPDFRMSLCNNEIQYQWDSTNTKWIPLEVSQTNLPNKSLSDTFSPGCTSKPIHSGFEEVLFGVKLRFVRPVSTTSPNNEFLGRGGQTRVTATDGSTTTGLATFGGSGFVLGDVGNIVHIESGSDAGIYKISTFTSSTSVSLKTMSGVVFSAAATAGTLTYTVWNFGAPGANAGPENASVLLADGFGKDNTQDITGMTYETYNFKSRLHDNDEGIKFAVENPIGVPGSVATKLYYETYAKSVPQYDAALSHHRALPASELTNGRQVLDWMVDKYLDGTTGRVSMTSGPDNNWSGITANSGILGCSPMVDFGKDVQVGYVQLRARATSSASTASVLYTTGGNGMLCNLYNASNAGGTPVASSVIRTSGVTNSVGTANVTTVTLSSGNFLGSITTGPNTVGTITSGLTILSDASNPFVASDLSKILDVTAAPGSATDIGSYRIIAVAGDGSSVTIRNLDQTTKTWNGSSGLNVTYSVRDGVQDEDMIAIPSLGSPTHKLCVERLLTSTSLQVRTAPNASFAAQSWQCVKSTWAKVKRLSYSSEAQRPDEPNNKTWITADGRERFEERDWKMYFDLTDLTSAQQTGRYWKLSLMPRFAADVIPGQFNFSSLEFFDTSGNRLYISSYSQTNEARTNADFLCNHVNRIDFIQSSNVANTGISGLNGNVDLGGANGDTLTLTTGGNKFIGFKIGITVTDGGLPIGTSIVNSASSAFPTSAMPGRFIRILTGANTGGVYRVSTRPSATQITVSTPAGGAVSWGATESSIQFSVHEGIAAGGVNADKIRFSDGVEYTIATIDSTSVTLTITESLQLARTNQTWEIIRPGYDTSSITTDATKNARLVRTNTTYPVQSGDMAHDSRGAYRFFTEDIGTGWQRTDGSVGGIGNTFTGTNFCSDDVGRLLYIMSGTNLGIYEIQTFSSSTSVVVKNHYTGAAVSLAVDAGPITYQVQGDRRFRISKYVVSLRA